MDWMEKLMDYEEIWTSGWMDGWTQPMETILKFDWTSVDYNV